MASNDDFLNALLDYFVAPLLPLKPSASEAPLHQQQLVATQIYPVVLFYNYYYLKQCDGAKFLGFQEFSKLASVLKPSLKAHMKLMHMPDCANVDYPEAKVSVTEKAIIDACDLSVQLDASKEVPNVEGWPVSRVSVLLTDYNKQNCFFQLHSTTKGVWSLIEKSLDDLPVEFDGKMKRKSVRKMETGETAIASNVDAICLQVAYYAIKEKTGIKPRNLVVLESHVVYSLSKAKTAVKFYIVQTNQSLGEDVQMPIKQILDSMQGPLVEKCMSIWTVTSVVEYFNVLPYAAILAEWFSRNEMQDPHVNVKIKDEPRNEMQDPHVNVEINVQPSESSVDSNTVINQKDNKALNIFPNSSAGPQNMVADNFSACPQKLFSAKVAPIQTVLRASIVESGKEKLRADTRERLSNRKVPPVTLDSKKTSPLAVLFKERSRLCSQRQAIEEEILACDKKIQEYLNGSVETLATVVKAIVEPCIDDDEGLKEQSIGKHLDDMCHENKWNLPTYNVKTSSDELTARVKFKGAGFDCTIKGDPQPNSHFARGSAAKYVIANLQDMAGKN